MSWQAHKDRSTEGVIQGRGRLWGCLPLAGGCSACSWLQRRWFGRTHKFRDRAWETKTKHISSCSSAHRWQQQSLC